MKIVFLFGATGSGKDYEAEKYIRRNYVKINFSEPCVKLLYDMLNIPVSARNHATYENIKVSNFKLNLNNDIISTGTGKDLLANITTGIIELNKTFWFDIYYDKIIKLYKENAETNIITTDLRYFESFEIISKLLQNVNIEVEFVYCDYKTDKYLLRQDEEIAIVAKNVSNLVHGDKLTFEDMLDLERQNKTRSDWLD